MTKRSLHAFSFVALALTGCAGVTEDADPAEEPTTTTKAPAPAPSESTGSTQEGLARGGGGGLGVGGSCVDQLQNCYIGCAVKHPEGDMRDGCEDSCDASYNLCRVYSVIGVGGGGIYAQ